MEHTYVKGKRIFYQNLDPKTGRRLPVPKGEKPPRMKIREAELGVKFEDDYREQYLSGKLGQKRFTERWGVKNRWQIFSQNPNARRRSWTTMLNLPLLGQVEFIIPEKTKRPSCEICGRSDVTLDKAHWIDAAAGGPELFWNIVSLCPNCHRQVDVDKIPQAIEAMKKAVLSRAVKRLVETESDSPDFKDRLLKVCESIITRQMISKKV
ncbi:MAG: HNH endonuclease [Desulfobulbaceae bacterium]|nr:HNH endonuclease [Desulfobulbaceae bacterium]